MLRTLLVGLDGTDHSRSALSLAIQWAKKANGMVVGMGVVDEPDLSVPEAVPLGASYYKEHSDAARRHRAEAAVANFLAQAALQCVEAGVAFKELQGVGAPHEQILREAQRYDLILLGQQTHFHFATRSGPCDTLRKVIHSAPGPVVVVPEFPTLGTSFLVAYDGNLQAARALKAFLGSGLADLGPVHLVTVDSDDAEASRQVQRAVDYLAHHGIAAKTQTTAPQGSVSATLLQAARECGAGAIVMGAYGQRFLREFFLGSVTSTMLKESSIPLFLYH